MRNPTAVIVIVVVMCTSITAVCICTMKEPTMGLFDKIRSAFSKKPAADGPLAAGPPADDAEMITVYDKYGRELLIPRKEWQEKVLPDWIKQHESDPEALCDSVVSSLPYAPNFPRRSAWASAKGIR